MSKHLTHSPLALRFEQALQPSKLLEQITTASENQYRDQLAEHGNPAFGLALASAKFVIDTKTITVVFEGGIPAGAKLMQSAGKAFPILVDGKTGRTVKLGTVASTGRVIASRAASTALIFVEAAHLISNHDNAKRLKKLERGVDSLLHAHESELKSRLEAVYRYSKELLHDDPNKLTDHDRRELHRQCRDLIELRARWRDEFRLRLGRIDRAEAGFWSKLFYFGRKESHRKSAREKAAESLDALQVVQLMHFSLLLQMALAGCAGKLDPFRKLTLDDECHDWRSLAELGRKRARFIAGESGLEEFRSFLRALDELAAFWAPERWNTTTPTPADVAKAKPRPAANPKPKPPTLAPPKEGWTVDTYAQAVGLTEQEAWHQLRGAAVEGTFAERRRGRTTHYVAAEEA